MTTIYKYELKPQELNEVPMPTGARLLSVGAQGPALMLWALVDITKPMAKRRVITALTGKPFPVQLCPVAFVGTAQMQLHRETELVLHVYDGGEQ